MTTYDWFGLYRLSLTPDFSDYKVFTHFSEDVYAGNGHQKEDFIVQCVYNGNPCNVTAFHTFRHAVSGNCFVFNSIMAQKEGERATPLKFTNDAPAKGLKISLFLEHDEYLGLMGQSSGKRNKKLGLRSSFQSYLFSSFNETPANHC